MTNGYKQRDFVRDFVFPLIIFDVVDDKLSYKKFLGTAFLVGNRGYALTSSHVLKDVNHNIAGMFAGEDGQWYCFAMEKVENHKTTDVSILKLQNGNWVSPFVISAEKQYGWKDYFLCGYPEMVLREQRDNLDIKGNVMERPDMISIKGHIRRRIPFTLDKLDIKNIRGNTFYELNNVAGWGCSGSPLFEIEPNRSWKVMGIYVAQKIFYLENENDDNTKYIDYSVGYAITSDAFANWKPDILDKSILEESKNFTV